MKTDIIYYFIKIFAIHFCLSYCTFKIVNYNSRLSAVCRLLVPIASIVLTTFHYLIQNTIPSFFIFIPIVLVYSFIVHKILSIDYTDAVTNTIISLAITYLLSNLSIIIASAIYATMRNVNYIKTHLTYNFLNLFGITLSSIINIIMVIFLFKIRRFKNGLSFLKNDYLKMLILLLTIIFIFVYSIGNRVLVIDNSSLNYLFASLSAVSFISFFIFRAVFILYQKQKNQIATLKSYEQELAETKEKLQTAIDEREKISKAQHELDKRQKALQQEINKLVNSTYNAEMANEFASILDRLNNLTKEYSFKTQALPNLSKTHISEIDNIITYLQNECAKNGIDFIFKLDCNIQKILDNYISCDKLETLIGDLVTNAIIAVNNSENSFKSIMLIIGLKDSFYQIDVYDSGKNFEIDTLLNLGIKKCSTYIGKGGSGYGWITTFETLNCSKASLTITELKDNNYSKFISIIFDNSNKYTVNSYRIDEIRKNKSTRKIFLNKI